MNEKQKKKQGLTGQIMNYASSNKKYYTASIILALCGVICSVLPYLFMAKIVALLIAGERSFDLFWPLLLQMLIFWTLRVVFHALSTSCSHVATFAVLGNIRKAVCKKLLRVPLGDVKNIPSGTLKNTIVERVDSMETTLAHILPEFTANIVAPVMIFIILLTIDWRMALISLITLPIGLFCLAGMMKDSANDWANCIEKTKVLNDTAVEYINGIEVIKAFGKADSSYEKFRIAAKDGADCFIEWMRKNIGYFSGAMAITPATMVTILPVGGVFWLRGTLSTADLIMIIILSAGLITPFITLMSYTDDMAKARTIFGEVDALLNMREMNHPDTQIAQHTDVCAREHSVVLSGVRFGYESVSDVIEKGSLSSARELQSGETMQKKKKEILHGIDMTISDGTVNALVGPSGSGKSTIARLIASLWDVDEGSIMIGGRDLKNLSLDEINQMIAYVSQDNYLFNTTIRENIRMGKKGASDEEVEAAAKACGCHDFIMGLENGYETKVGDSGGHLSGGERQRISIARAMLKDAPIIILDEATAYTDPENEALIQRSLARIIQGKTILIIAHRLSTIVDADQIFVIENGMVNDHGTHEELIARGGLYRNMWEAHISAKDSGEMGGVSYA